MTLKEINIEIITSLKDGGRNIDSLIEELSYENQIDEMLVTGIVNKMIKQGWIARYGDVIDLRFPYSVY